MKVFVCWSGNRGQEFAGITARWIRRVVGKPLQPMISVDIAKGAVWFNELSTALEGAGAGILCLTPEALQSPWIHYEAGVLVHTVARRSGIRPGTKTQPRRVFPFVLGVGAAELSGPLAAFQTTKADSREDTLRLVEALAEAMPDAGRPDLGRVRRRFDKHWTALQSRLAAIEPTSIDEVFKGLEELFERKTFNEPIFDCLDQRWLARYDGAKETLAKLEDRRETVHQACRRYVSDLFDALIAEVDAYAMDVSLLVNVQEFPIDATGRVRIEPPGLVEACEKRRREIKALVARLVDPSQAPVFDEAVRFEAAETFEQRKRLIHRMTGELPTVWMGVRQRRRPNADWADSDWDFDRIMYYLSRERSPKGHDASEALRRSATELEKVNAKQEGASLMGLYYSLRSLLRALKDRSNRDTREGVRRLVDNVRRYIDPTKADRGGEVRRILAQIEALLSQPVRSTAAPRVQRSRKRRGS